MKNKIKKIIKLTYIFLIIGLESLGNMSAVAAVLEENLIKKNQLVTEEDIIDAVTLSRIGPGATTANAVAFLGNKIAGIGGCILATICYTVCPLIVILLIYGSLQKLLEYSFVESALKGGLIYISIMFFESTVKIGKKVLTDKFNIAVFVCCLTATIIFKISCLYIIIFAVVIGIIKVYFVQKNKKFYLNP